MAGKRRRQRSETPKIALKEEESVDVKVKPVGEYSNSIDVEKDKEKASVSPVKSESELARVKLRERWELASVFNFLHVFKPVIQSKLDASAEDIETALITPNIVLTELHISLLKGIPPVSKNLTPDAWVTVLYKKLAPWWTWVAEGETAPGAVQGEEIFNYKVLDPINRLLILKALCEIRAFQDDAVSYINDALKQGTTVCTFRKDRIGGDSAGIAYWNDGDEVIGYRLYREAAKVDFTPRKGKGRLAQPPNSYQWETLATNLEEFRHISDELSSSEVVGTVAVGKNVQNEIIPVLEGIEKKKERALKRQQKQVMLLNGYLNSCQLGGTRSCRSRKPVNYTFDDFDKSIEEAIQIDKKRKTIQESKHGKKETRYEGSNDANVNDNSLNNGIMERGCDDDDDDDDDDNFRGVSGDSDSGDQDYNDRSDENSADMENDDEDDNDRSVDSASSMENNNLRTRATRNSQKNNGYVARDVDGLRRSKRITGNAGQLDLEGIKRVKVQKQRSGSTDSDEDTVSDSDNGSSSRSSTHKKSDTGKDSSDRSLSQSSADKTSDAGKDSDDGNSSKNSANKASDAGNDSDDGSMSKSSGNKTSNGGNESSDDSEELLKEREESEEIDSAK